MMNAAGFKPAFMPPSVRIGATSVEIINPKKLAARYATG